MWERAAPHVTGWSAQILGFGDRDMPDAAHGHTILDWRQTQGLWVPSARFMGLDIRVPDYSTLSRRAKRGELSLR